MVAAVAAAAAVVMVAAVLRNVNENQCAFCWLTRAVAGAKAATRRPLVCCASGRVVCRLFVQLIA